MTELYAATAYRALNGVFCIYKPAGCHVTEVISSLRSKLFRELNALPCRPTKDRVILHAENLDTNLPTVTTVPDLADHPLAVGPRYIIDDFHIRPAGGLGKHASGVMVMGIGSGVSLLPSIVRAKYLRVYHVQGQFGLATQNFSLAGRMIMKTTFQHVTPARIDRVVAGMQAGHQKHMFLAAGIDLQTQEAYNLAVQGLLRPGVGNHGPVIYGMKCIEFNPPDFTLEIHAVDEPTYYLMKLVHEIGLECRSSAVCTQVRRIRYGHFELVHALLMKHCDAQSIAENIEVCCALLPRDNIRRTKQILVGSDPHRPLLEKTEQLRLGA